MKHPIRERAIFALLDGSLKDTERHDLEAHLEQCDDCRAFFKQATFGMGVLKGIDSTPLQDVNWTRVDANLNANTAKEKRSFFGNMVLWGAMAAATATAVLITFIVSDRTDPTPSVASTEVNNATTEEVETLDPISLEAFVTFVAGEAGVAGPGEPWQEINLESPLSIGSRLRTTDHGIVGLQLGTNHACRLQPESEVRFTNLSSPNARIELHEGQVICTSTGDEEDEARLPLVLSVMDVVASASGEARFSMSSERRESQIIVVELAEGTLRVSPGGEESTMSSPGRLTFSAGENGELETTPSEAELPSPLLLERRTISSLHIPAIEGVERVTVDGVSYDHFPLQIRRAPGTARLELFTDRGESIVHEVHIGLGPRVLEIASLGLLNTDVVERAPGERRVAPRIGTYNDAHVRRLRSVVSNKVRRCYERMLKRNPSIWGRINVRFTVSTSGEPRQVRVRSLAGGDGGVNSCIEQALSNEQFPPPIGGYIPIEQNITLSPQF